MIYSDYPGLAPEGKNIQAVSYGTAKLDTINNAEVIEINKPSAGDWRLDVTASNIPQGPQDFTLVYLA